MDPSGLQLGVTCQFFIGQRIWKKSFTFMNSLDRTMGTSNRGYHPQTRHWTTLSSRRPEHPSSWTIANSIFKSVPGLKLRLLMIFYPRFVWSKLPTPWKSNLPNHHAFREWCTFPWGVHALFMTRNGIVLNPGIDSLFLRFPVLVTKFQYPMGNL